MREYFQWNGTVSWCTIHPPPNRTPAVYPLHNVYCRHIVNDAVWQSLIEDTDFRLHTVYSSFPVSDNGLKVISEETREDAKLRNTVKRWMDDARRYLLQSPGTTLSVINGLVFEGKKIITPASWRAQMRSYGQNGHKKMYTVYILFGLGWKSRLG